MTRETRIGLLVGLLFIIMFGLVLSGLTNSNPPPVTATTASNTAANTPAGDVRDIVFVPTMDSERRPVPEQAPAPATGPVADASATPGVPTPDGSVAMARVNPEPVNGAPASVGPLAAADNTSVAAAGGHGEAVVTPGGVATVTMDNLPRTLSARTDNATNGDARSTEIVPTANTMYEVKKGDTLCQIAKQQYGAAYASKGTLIFEANKDKLKSPTSLQIGMKLVIPPLPQTATVAPPANSTVRTRGATSQPTTPIVPPARNSGTRSGLARADGDSDSTMPLAANHTVAVSPAVVTPASRTYTVKNGDTIFKIAKSNGVPAEKILKANRVKPKELKIGMKLEIPV